MLAVIVVVPAVVYSQPRMQVGNIEQRASGTCGVNVAGVAGPVTIICPGFNPRQMAEMNRGLRNLNLAIEARLAAAEKWKEQYVDLANQLAAARINEGLKRKALLLLQEGKLEQAALMLEDLAAQQDDEVASTHFTCANAYDLGFRPDKALPHYEKAYQLRSDVFAHAHTYATALIRMNLWQQADPVVTKALTIARRSVQADRGKYLADLAQALQTAGVIYKFTYRVDDAQRASIESLMHHRELFKAEPRKYGTELAMALNNLGSLVGANSEVKPAEDMLAESVAILRTTRDGSPLRELHLSGALMNLGKVYLIGNRDNKAEEALTEAFNVHKTLSTTSIEFMPGYAAVQMNLANLYSLTNRSEKAYAHVQDAVLTCEKLVTRNRAIHLPLLAEAYKVQAAIQERNKEWDRAASTYESALSITRELAKEQQSRFEPQIAELLGSQSRMWRVSGNSEQARRAADERIGIYRQLVKTNRGFVTMLAKALVDSGALYHSLSSTDSAVAAFSEAVTLYEEGVRINPRFRAEHVQAVENLANIYGASGRVAESVPVFVRAVALRKQLLDGTVEPLQNLLNTLTSLAIAYRMAALADERSKTCSVISEVYTEIAAKGAVHQRDARANFACSSGPSSDAR